MSKKIAIIPARYASSRFPGKPLALIHGKSMIERTYEQVAASGLFHDIVVATDDQRILQHCQDKNINAMLTSSAHTTGTERCAEVLSKHTDSFDFAINIQGDEPFISPKSIQMIVALITSSNCDIATLCRTTQDKKSIENPNNVKVVKSTQNKALYFSRSIIPFQRDTQHIPIDYFIHLGIYAFRTDILKEIICLKPSSLEQAESLEQLRWLENGYSIAIEESPYDSIGVDTPEDISLIEAQIKKGILK